MVWELSEDNGELAEAIRQNWNGGSTASLPETKLIESFPKSNGVWQLAWSEDFDYAGAPDPRFWNLVKGAGTSGEMEQYTSDNVKVENGMLVITATQGNNGWTSGQITTKNLLHLKYGRIEARVKFPTGSGTWPIVSLV
ncbi:glycoside hydrolase family 16 protein [Gonapodya prolifera JEL478]|uniref:Glycoside hydrolase family 16 protein n=1 Tax=Gonapodya prolifera (strain JEL478) TaxID=1344416 RepID=A0A139APQ7_GONPJ|nr:glycoside hydrolase family 16 protein [Gonapodya prolifera JEL478]|eukprot:KXS18730.1 glycoside hydrolase family 16 protein [Gonapodya prolifera JEL478]